MDPELKQIRTFQGDVAEAIKDQKESLYSIHRAEGWKQPEEAQGPKKILLLLIGGITLFILAIGLGYFAYKEYVRKTTPPARIVPESQFITPDNSLKHIVVPETFGQFLEKNAVQAPGSLTRAVSPVFMIGTLNENRFMILKVTSYENAYAGMLQWENDFAPNSVFKDVVSRNKDARVLYAGTTPVVLYSFFDNKWIIITTNLETLHILIDRLTRQLLVH